MIVPFCPARPFPLPNPPLPSRREKRGLKSDDLAIPEMNYYKENSIFETYSAKQMLKMWLAVNLQRFITSYLLEQLSILTNMFELLTRTFDHK